MNLRKNSFQLQIENYENFKFLYILQEQLINMLRPSSYPVNKKKMYISEALQQDQTRSPNENKSIFSMDFLQKEV